MEIIPEVKPCVAVLSRAPQGRATPGLALPSG